MYLILLAQSMGDPMSFVVIRGDDLFLDLPPQQAADKVRELLAEDKGEVFLQDAFGDPWGLEELI